MKILNVAYFGISGKLNGISEAVLNLAKSQIALGNSVKICIYNNQRIVDNQFIYLTVDLKSFINLHSLYKPDIVVFHSLYEYQQISFSWYLRSVGTPYILVYHGGASRDNAKKNWFKKKIANLLFWNHFIRKASKVVYLNEQEEKQSVFRRTNPNYCIIPNGVFIDRRHIIPKRIGPVNIIYMGRLDYYGKGLDLLFPVIERLRKEYNEIDLRFSFYGHSFDETYLQVNKLEPMAHWFGFVMDDAKRDAYSQGDALILPSRSEGMPMCVLEALSYGIPCIVTKETNMLELIENNNLGWRIELTQDSIYRQIINVFECLKKDRIGYFDRCRSVAEQFSWDAIALHSIEMYKQCIEKYG